MSNATSWPHACNHQHAQLCFRCFVVPPTLFCNRVARSCASASRPTASRSIACFLPALQAFVLFSAHCHCLVLPSTILGSSKSLTGPDAVTTKNIAQIAEVAHGSTQTLLPQGEPWLMHTNLSDALTLKSREHDLRLSTCSSRLMHVHSILLCHTIWPLVILRA